MCCRVRLMSAMESGDDRFKEKGYNILDQRQSIQTDNKEEVFVFDKTYSENAEQKRIWPEAEQLIEWTIGPGKNTSIICYGQTSSGKTFTIQGTDKQPGIILRAFEFLEQEIINRNLTVTCCMAEIYMKEMRDLFKKPGDLVEPMWIKDDGSIHGITLHSARDAKELRKAFEFGI